MTKQLKDRTNIICPECNGTGKIDLPDSLKEMLGSFSKGTIITCLNCCGEGELDWIEAITGKKIPNQYQKLIKLRNPIKDDLLSIRYGYEFPNKNKFLQTKFESFPNKKE